MNNFADWWLDYVAFGGFNLSIWCADKAADFLGEYAAFVTIVLMLPITIALFIIGVLLSGVLVGAIVLLAPIVIPVQLLLKVLK